MLFSEFANFIQVVKFIGIRFFIISSYILSFLLTSHSLLNPMSLSFPLLCCKHPFIVASILQSNVQLAFIFYLTQLLCLAPEWSCGPLGLSSDPSFFTFHVTYHKNFAEGEGEKLWCLHRVLFSSNFKTVS